MRRFVAAKNDIPGKEYAHTFSKEFRFSEEQLEVELSYTKQKFSFYLITSQNLSVPPANEVLNIGVPQSLEALAEEYYQHEGLLKKQTKVL